MYRDCLLKHDKRMIAVFPPLFADYRVGQNAAVTLIIYATKRRNCGDLQTFWQTSTLLQRKQVYLNNFVTKWRQVDERKVNRHGQWDMLKFIKSV